MASDNERNALKEILQDRLIDVFRVFEHSEGFWSWWDYRSGAWQRDKGWRIDHIYLCEELLKTAKSCRIHKKVRGNQQPSDHAPVIVDLAWPKNSDDDDDVFDNDFF